MDQKDISKDKKILTWRKSIAASLEFGRVFSRGFIGFIYVFLIYLVGCTIFAIVVAVYYVEYEALYCLILLGIGLVCFPAIIIYHHWLLKKLTPFLNDAVECVADSVEIGVHKQIEGLYLTKRKKISVKFICNGKKIVRESGQKGYEKQYLYNTKAGYEKIFAKYANRQIRILYSPQYDQVLILKDCKKAK